MRIRSPKSDHGNILMVALVVAGVTGLALTSYLSLLSNENALSHRSQVWNSALPMAEAGIEEGIAHLTASPDLWTTNGWTNIGGAVQMARPLGDGFYSITVSNPSLPTIISQGNVPAPMSTTEFISRTIRVVLLTKPDIGPGLSAKTTIELNGNKLTVDSFNSSDPTKSDRFGMYDKNYHGDDVTVLSAGGFADSVNVGNAEIWGQVATAAGGSVEILKKGKVGDETWHASGSDKGIQPGASTSDAEMVFATLASPTGGSAPPVVAGTTYLSNGVYEVSSLTGPVIVTGEATLVVRDTFALTGTDAIIINSGAKLDLYVHAPTASFGAGSYNTTPGSQARNLRYFGMPSNTEINLDGATTIYGVLFAPDAALNCDGGGSGLNFCGSSVTKSVVMNGNYEFHYDEALVAEAEKGFVIHSWDEL